MNYLLAPFETQAKSFEQNSEWSKAANRWYLAGSKVNADACQMIADAVARGDRFRELLVDANEQYEKRILNIYQYTELVNEAHKRVYS